MSSWNLSLLKRCLSACSHTLNTSVWAWFWDGSYQFEICFPTLKTGHLNWKFNITAALLYISCYAPPCHWIVIDLSRCTSTLSSPYFPPCSNARLLTKRWHFPKWLEKAHPNSLPCNSAGNTQLRTTCRSDIEKWLQGTALNKKQVYLYPILVPALISFVVPGADISPTSSKYPTLYKDWNFIGKGGGYQVNYARNQDLSLLEQVKIFKPFQMEKAGFFFESSESFIKIQLIEWICRQGISPPLRIQESNPTPKYFLQLSILLAD